MPPGRHSHLGGQNQVPAPLLYFTLPQVHMQDTTVWWIAISAEYQWQDRQTNLSCTLDLRMANSFLPAVLHFSSLAWDTSSRNRDPDALYFRPSFNALVKLLPPPSPFLFNWRYKERNKQKSPQNPTTG